MSSHRPNLFTRDDTLLGVCEALGEDFGFNPLFLRIALGLGLFWNPVAVIAAYLGAGVLVLFSRLVFPTRRAQADRPAEPVAPAPVLADNDMAAAPMAVAA